MPNKAMYRIARKKTLSMFFFVLYKEHQSLEIYNQPTELKFSPVYFQEDVFTTPSYQKQLMSITDRLTHFNIGRLMPKIDIIVLMCPRSRFVFIFIPCINSELQSLRKKQLKYGG